MLRQVVVTTCDVAITSGDDGRQTKPYERSGDEEQSHMQTTETSGNDTGYKSTLFNRVNDDPQDDDHSIHATSDNPTADHKNDDTLYLRRV
jgi:hypothetical protein